MYIFWFDTETSGLDPKKNQILQFAYIMTDETFKELKRGKTYVKYEGADEDWSMEAQAVHGLTREFLEENGVSQDDLRDFIVEAVGNEGFAPYPAGHNVQFDLSFIRELFPRDMFRNLLDYHPIDSMVMAQSINITTQMRFNKKFFKNVKCMNIHRKGRTTRGSKA